ncbi:hypothetical protein [Nibribacter ruber]|nr:hypothetical protein [Nibribacter ruber]
MYYNHNLRTNLQEWKNRLYRANYSQFGNQINYFINNIESEKILASILLEGKLKYGLDSEKVEEFIKAEDSRGFLQFDGEDEQATYVYLMIKHLFAKHGPNNLLYSSLLGRASFDDSKSHFLEAYITPLVNYLHDKLDKSNSTIFLLEKYKKRTEWFNRERLYSLYKSATKSYEQILEDDLRLFLFDQGIDYPFSTPKSVSGRADIIGALDTDDPLVIEVKVFDSEKGYKVNRIKEGLTQIIKYTNDYHKDFGYLVVFNLDDVEIDFNFNEERKYFPPRLVINNKCFFLVVVNVKPPLTSASKAGKSTKLEITEQILLDS